MAGIGPPPAKTRRRRNVPSRGDWQAITDVGWQHGDIPAPPPGISNAAREAWQAWMTAWFASKWTPNDLPFLRLTCRLYSKVYGGSRNVTGAERTQLQQMSKAFGITPEGQAALRWTRPDTDTKPVEPEEEAAPPAPYAGLRAV